MRTKKTHENQLKTLALRQLERLRNIGKNIKRSQDGEREKSKPLKGSVTNSVFTTPQDASCSVFSNFSIDANSWENNFFSCSPKTPNCLRNWSSRDKKVWCFSLRREHFSINDNSFARSPASLAQALFNSSCKDNFCLSTQSPRRNSLGTLQDNGKGDWQSPWVTSKLHLRFFSIQWPQRPEKTSIRQSASTRRQPEQDLDIFLLLAATWEAKQKRRLVESSLSMVRRKLKDSEDQNQEGGRWC